MDRVIAEITEVRGSGQCSAGHRVGERFVFTRERTPALCPWALGALLAPVAVLLNGGRFYWAEGDEPTSWCCPDPDTTVVFRLYREK
ncbi:TIGR04076 family protein [Moorellaceae bacterium AZ2]